MHKNYFVSNLFLYEPQKPRQVFTREHHKSHPSNAWLLCLTVENLPSATGPFEGADYLTFNTRFTLIFLQRCLTWFRKRHRSIHSRVNGKQCKIY